MSGELLNFRDVGGLATTDGRRTQPGVLFRSDNIGALTTEGRLGLHERFGIVAAIDLRSEFEELFIGGVDTTATGLTVRRVPILDGSMLETARQGGLTLRHVYERVAFDGAESVARAIATLADPETLPALVFCTAGKDRTGIVVAVLLAALGAEREAIVEDYTRSAASGKALFERMVAGLDVENVPDIPVEMLDAPADAITDVLDRIDARFGSVRTYLLQSGLSPGEHALLTGALLTD